MGDLRKKTQPKIIDYSKSKHLTELEKKGFFDPRRGLNNDLLIGDYKFSLPAHSTTLDSIYKKS